MKLLEQIKQNSITHPENIAVVHRNESMTYLELEQLSNGLAQLIKSSETPVVLYGHMSKWMLVGMIAGLKSGIGYVPVDTSIPEDRIEKILKTVDPRYIFTEHRLASFSDYTVVQPDIITKKEQFRPLIQDTDVAYTIFTSGSTGNPKGVMIRYDSLCEFTLWMDSLYVPCNKNYWLNQAPLSFDLSVMAIYPSLYTNSTLVMIDKAMIKKPIEIFETLKRYPISAWVSTPSFLEMCLLLPEFDTEHHANLKHFYFCGEMLKHKTADSLLKKFSTSDLYNTYGPTEATVAVTSIKVTEDILSRYNPLPVGYSRPGTMLSLSTNDELVISGDSVSIGYVKDIEKTATQFYTTDVRNYKTGDKAHVENDLWFIDGRLDFQIKLNGYRMELEEIEHSISEINGINQAIVVPVIKRDKVHHLHAFIVTETRMLSQEEIKSSLKSALPDYMIPQKIEQVEHLRMTPNGKVDRKYYKEVVS